MPALNQPSMLVSVIVPLYNAEQYITQALRSLLQESSISLEVIVVDDGSTDDSLKAVRAIQDDRLQVVSNPGKGIASALNFGLSIAQGQIIMRCDADDLYCADRLRIQTDWLRQHPDFAAVCSNYVAIDARSDLVIQFNCGTKSEEITQELCTGITRTHFCTYAIRAESLRQLGGFRPYFTTAEDIDLQLRLGEQFRIWYLPINCYQYRIHRHSITHTQSTTRREFFDFIAQEFQQQRRTIGEDDLQRGCPPPPPEDNIKAAFSAASHIQTFLLGRAWSEFEAGQLRQAWRSGVRAALAAPRNPIAWRNLLVLNLKLFSKLLRRMVSPIMALGVVGSRE
ncbi:glycosyltransferase family 2 protein [Egbenema bharatensis]|uniref:glycosyltransferase family 2 protein n=1 Tax=Egbenema bharatensis TaxID=3463334 RepID=UPI003A85D842